MVPPNTDLEKEIREASHVLTLEEHALKSGTTLRAKGKDALKSADHLGRSPDVLDAAALACYTGFSTAYTDPSISGVVG
jgi:hypothetical protein